MAYLADSKKSSPTIPLEELFSDFSPKIKEPLELLEDDEIFAVMVGRDESSHRKNGLRGTLFLGLVCESTTGHFGKKILIDALNPHKIFKFSHLSSDPLINLNISNKSAYQKLFWPKNWGILRGGTPAQKVGNEYLAFFHSSFNVW